MEPGINYVLFLVVFIVSMLKIIITLEQIRDKKEK